MGPRNHTRNSFTPISREVFVSSSHSLIFLCNSLKPFRLVQEPHCFFGMPRVIIPQLRASLILPHTMGQNSNKFYFDWIEDEWNIKVTPT